MRLEMNAEWRQFMDAYQHLFEELPADRRLEILSHPRGEDAADLLLQALREIQPPERRGMAVFELHHS